MEAIQAILLGEVREAIQRLPLKAAGYDDLPAELFKLDDDAITHLFCTLCNKVINTGTWPEYWRRSVFITIPNVSVRMKCEEHCTIVLISHASKILLRIGPTAKQNAEDSRGADS